MHKSTTVVLMIIKLRAAPFPKMKLNKSFNCVQSPFAIPVHHQSLINGAIDNPPTNLHQEISNNRRSNIVLKVATVNDNYNDVEDLQALSYLSVSKHTECSLLRKITTNISKHFFMKPQDLNQVS